MLISYKYLTGFIMCITNFINNKKSSPKRCNFLNQHLDLRWWTGGGLPALAVSDVMTLSSPLSSSLDVRSSSDGAVIVDVTLSDVEIVRPSLPSLP